MHWMIPVMAVESPASPCLEVEGLCITYPGSGGMIEAVRDVCLSLAEAECLGIVGESGSGKSQTCLSIMGLLARPAQVKGRIRFRGHELTGQAASRMRQIRGRDMAMIFQDSMGGLTPHLRIGTQLGEVLQGHFPIGRKEAQAQSARMLERVGIDRVGQRLRQYPHQLSGGMRQRVMIAMACMCRPGLLLADEPTTALDAPVQAQVLDLLRSLRAEIGMAIVLVTHDLSLLAGLADRIAVMYAGRVVELAGAQDLYAQPAHPYTAGLLACVPRGSSIPVDRFPSIPGNPPAPGTMVPGCDFAPRCARAQARCHQIRPTLMPSGGGRKVACHFPHA